MKDISDHPLPRVVECDAENHYLWGEGCEGWRLLNDANFSVIYERMAPHTKEVMHHHEHASQFFFIVEGEAWMAWDRHEAVKLIQGQGIHIPPHTPHQFCNRSEHDVSFLVISQPSTQGDRYEHHIESHDDTP